MQHPYNRSTTTAAHPADLQSALWDCSFGTLEDTIACGLREAGAADVASVLIEECGDWPAEEQPAALAGAIDGFAARVWST
jgi:hypothetical protein